jgi:transcriptional regulator with XRE-family HTH domain
MDFMAEVFGSLVREKRLSLGLSLGQLASQVSRTAATVRAWERGERVPDAATIRKLAAVLGADSAELQAAADGMGAALSGAEPKDIDRTDSENVADHNATGAATIAYVASGDGPLDGGDIVDAIFAESPAEVVVTEVPIVDLPTEAIRVVTPEPGDAPAQDMTIPTQPSEAVGPGTDMPAPPSGNEFQRAIAAVRKVYNTIFDPEKRYLYWIRGVLLLVGLYVLLRVGRDATSGLLEAFGDFLDTFGRGEKPDTAVDTLVSLSGLI